ncbi:MAG: hypothetical protein WCC22_06685 [Terriglobales bacterium]
MIEDALLALFCWIVGFAATTKTDWAVRQGLAMQKRYPNAFASRLAERSWYPKFLRVGGVVLLLFAAIFSFKVALQIWLRSRS